MATTVYDDIINSAAKQYNLEPALIKAFIQAESSWKSTAMRKESEKDYSYGLMQVMLSTARWLLNNPNLTPQQLIQPTVNILVGAKYIRYQMDRYPNNLSDVIAAYNSGTPRKTTTGKYINQIYVDRVLKYYNQYKTGKPVVAFLEFSPSTVITLLGFGIFALVLFQPTSKIRKF